MNIGTGCPGDTTVNTNVRFQGTVDYTLKNAGDEDGAVEISITLSDSAGNNTHFSSSLQVVAANGSFSDSHLLFLDAAYTTPGRIHVTMRIDFSGALTDTKSAECDFNVNAP